ncbi:MAG: hypothetical protein AB7U20_02300 [Planctomycetaceae bacterium]
MRRCLLLLAFAAGVSLFAPRAGCAFPVSLLSDQIMAGDESVSVRLPPDIVAEIWEIVTRDMVPQVVENLTLMGGGGGSLQPSTTSSGPGTGGASPVGLPAAAPSCATAAPLVSHIVESRLLIPIRFLDGIFRPPQR